MASDFGISGFLGRVHGTEVHGTLVTWLVTASIS